MSVDIYRDVFNDNLPESINWDSQIQAIGLTSDTKAVGLQGILPYLLVLCNIPNLNESILDLLAFQFQVLFYTETFSITDPVARLAAKRQLIANNFYYHAHLGTPATVEQIVAAVFQPAIIQEWFLYGGLANHFRVLLPSVIDPATEAQMLQLITVVKRASQAMDGFFLYSAAPTNFYVAVGVFTQIWLFLPLPISHPNRNYLSPGISVFAKATVQRSTAVISLITGLKVLATARQIVQGAPTADIHTGISVHATAKVLGSAFAKIILGGRLAITVSK
jgi:P2-related tail formation protein